MLTVERLKEVLEYDAENGGLVWARVHPGIKKGKEAGTFDKDGYRQVNVDSRFYKMHRLVWLYHNGDWPSLNIDHINGIRCDNRIENLREATQSQNQRNRVKSFKCKSGFKGVDFHIQAGKWRATIRMNGKQKHIGYFSTPEEASAAYERAAKDFHGEFYCHPR